MPLLLWSSRETHLVCQPLTAAAVRCQVRGEKPANQRETRLHTVLAFRRKVVSTLYTPECSENHVVPTLHNPAGSEDQLIPTLHTPACSEDRLLSTLYAHASVFRIPTLHMPASSEDQLISTLPSHASMFKRPTRLCTSHSCVFRSPTRLHTSHSSVFRRGLSGLQHPLLFVNFAYASDWLFSCPSSVEKETFHKCCENGLNVVVCFQVVL